MRKKEVAYLTGLAALFVAVVGFVAAPLYSNGGNGQTTLSSSRVLSSIIRSSTASSSNGSLGGEGPLYDVTFYDGGPCNSYYPAGPFFLKWGVQLGDRNLTEPSNITLSQISENGYSWGSSNLTTIVFSVPRGAYHFTVYPTAFVTIDSPSGFPLGGPSGVVNVTDSDVTIYTGGSNALRCGP
jgi:hypothetical protein